MTPRRLSVFLATAGLAVSTVAVAVAVSPGARAGTTPSASVSASASVVSPSGLPSTTASATPTPTPTSIPTPPPPAVKPQVRLIPAQDTITVNYNGKYTYMDPGIWVTSQGAPLQFNVSRASYTKPVTISEVLGGSSRPLSASLLDRWNGLRDFFHLTVVNAKGKRVGNKTLTFCPDTYDPERATDGGPLTSPYPTSCGTFDPFPLGEVWGIAKDWGVDPAQGFGATFNLPVGTYKITESITRMYAGLLGIPAKDGSVTVTADVVKGSGCCGPGCCSAPVPASFVGSGKHFRPAALPELSASVPTMTNPPASVLPDLVPLPSWGIRVSRSGKADLLSFGATVWIGGNGPLDVEGFRNNGSPVMPAYQYFFNSAGQVVGRARAGTMGFDSAKGHEHWHFQQFAEYQLLGASKKLVVRSTKVGFCIAPTDQVDLTLHAASWQPPALGFGGQCGSPTALWVQESLPVGWGDTYLQYVAGQAFDITNLKNGTYYIEITANPEHVLHEASTSNDVSLREVIISGTKGHRHVTVPAWNGIDPEKG
jgi:hypothetical protein